MKKQQIDMGNYLPSELEKEAMHWCINNNIRISPKAISTVSWSVIIDLNKKLNEDPVAYPKVEIWKKIYQYYKYYYEKYGKKQI